MITEFPFVTADDIAAHFRPTGTATPKSALDTLRRNQLLTDGITKTLQGDGGRMAGTIRLYSSLMRDAAAAAGVGHGAEARALVARARQLERRQDAQRIVTAVAAAASTAVPGTWAIAALLRTVCDQPAIAKAMAGHAQAMAKLRATGPAVDQIAAGHVTSLLDGLAEVRLLDGAITQIPIAELPDPGSEIGDPVILRWTKLPKGVWMTTESALELLPGIAVFVGARPAAGIYPYDRAADRGPFVIPTAVLSGPPTVRRSGRSTVID